MDRQAQKRLARRKAYEKQRNERHNLPKVKYKLNVKVDGKWRDGVMGFRDMDAVTKHIEGTKELRQKGTVEIVEGEVVALGSGKVVAHIDAFKPATTPAALGQGAHGSV